MRAAPQHEPPAHARVRASSCVGPRLANPGSPTSITTEPGPRSASSNAERSRSSSCSRPTNTPSARRSSGFALESEWARLDFCVGSTRGTQRLHNLGRGLKAGRREPSATGEG